ncbi:MAG: hypothetical protein ACFFB0_09245 [Promethearchaeota archaeon]
MVEFCENCNGMMLPSKDKTKKVLICNLCGKSKPLEADIIESYVYIKEIDHHPGEEFKNLEKMKNWRNSKKNNLS